MKHLTQLEEKVPQGTPPLLIDSNTLVTNLNADLLDGNHASTFATTAHTHVKADITDLGTPGDMTKIVYDTDDDGVVDKAEGVVNLNGGTLINGTWVGTLAQYTAIGSKDANTTYIITDEPKIYQGTILLGQLTTTAIVRW